jgi:hypothetical protein
MTSDALVPYQQYDGRLDVAASLKGKAAIMRVLLHLKLASHRLIGEKIKYLLSPFFFCEWL